MSSAFRQVESIKAKRILAATGAMERAVPIPGWTLPGVMGAGAAQTLLKSGAMTPTGPVVLAGGGPLLLLVAAQLLDAGAEVTAVLETTGIGDYLAAARHLPGALIAGSELRRGLALRRAIRARGVPITGGVRHLRAEGGEAVSRVIYDAGVGEQSIETATLLLHVGVVPNVQITRLLRCDHEWVTPQRYWRPVLDEWGASSLECLAVAGDGGEIFGAKSAEAAGRLAALDAGHRLGALSACERDAKARDWREMKRKNDALRPLLDKLFVPPDWVLSPPVAETVVCRCEEVTAGEIRDCVAMGAMGPNQMKAFLRCGMGPCQGRICGLNVVETIADARGMSPPEIGYYRIRPPIKPVTLGELAALDD